MFGTGGGIGSWCVLGLGWAGLVIMATTLQGPNTAKADDILHSCWLSFRQRFQVVSRKMSAEDSWVFDSLVCFLHGPVWNAPLQTFIEQKSLGKRHSRWVSVNSVTAFCCSIRSECAY